MSDDRLTPEREAEIRESARQAERRPGPYRGLVSARDSAALLAELDALRRQRDALLDAARDVLEEAPEHAGCVPRSGCAYAALRAAVEACGPKEGT